MKNQSLHTAMLTSSQLIHGFCSLKKKVSFSFSVLSPTRGLEIVGGEGAE